eukprot:9744-Hanusia_phi.AAC.1
MRDAGGASRAAVAGEEDEEMKVKVLSADQLASGTSDELLEEEDVDYEDALDAMGVGAYQKLLMVVCGLANATDAIEILSLSYIIPEIETEIAAWSLGALSSAVFAGMLVGALVGGFTSDVLGRRPVLMCSMLLNAIFTALFALASGEFVMVALRFFTGFGVGASVPV